MVDIVIEIENYQLVPKETRNISGVCCTGLRLVMPSRLFATFPTGILVKATSRVEIEHFGMHSRAEAHKKVIKIVIINYLKVKLNFKDAFCIIVNY